MTENEPIYHARNVKRWKGLDETSNFHRFTNIILDVINRFNFGHGVLIHNVLYMLS